MIKGAVIGLGKMGLSHTCILGAHPQVDLVAICDSSAFMLEAFKQFSSIDTYCDYKELIDNKSLDFVLIATPTRLHYPMAKYAIEKELHVFCEKPLGLKLIEDEELVTIAEKNSIVNQVGYHNHFIGTFRELHRLLQLNILGNLVYFSGEAFGPVVTKEKGSTWRGKPNEGGGCLYDYASHVINLIQEILGNPAEILGSKLINIYSKDVEDIVSASIMLDNKLCGNILVNWSDNTYRKMTTILTVQGTKGKIICDATEIKIYLNEKNSSEGLNRGWNIKYITDLALPVNYYLRGEEYTAQIDYFINCIINNKKPLHNTFKKGFYTDKVIEMIKLNSKSIN